MKTLKELAIQANLSTNRISQLKEILKSFKQLTNVQVKVETCMVEFEKTSGYEYRGGEWIARENYGTKPQEANVYMVTSNEGSYKISVPTCSDLNKEYLAYFGLNEAKPQTNAEIFAIFETDILEYLKEAAKYVIVDKTGLYEKMTQVVIDFKGGKANIVAKNGHILYLKELDCAYSYEYQMCIPTSIIKELVSKKHPVKQIELLSKFFSHKNGDFSENVFRLNETIFTENHVNFVPYENVLLQDLDKAMKFEKKRMLAVIDMVKGCANRNNTLEFHLNGAIQVVAKDIDFEREAKQSIEYVSKNFGDLDIKFNAKHLTQCIKSFKENELTMYFKSSKTAAMLVNETTKVLVMPQLI